MKDSIKMQIQEFIAVGIARNNSFSVWLDECAFPALTTTQMVQETSSAECVHHIRIYLRVTCCPSLEHHGWFTFTG
jgi:hypothetical protein